MSTVDLRLGDCLELMRNLPDNSVDTCITDPPYALEFMGQGWDKVLPSVDVWREVLRVMKPGAMLLAFGGTRTYHRLTVAIEDAGFEIRDCMMWLYGQGFPKSLDISKAIDKTAGAEREVVGYGTNGMGRMNQNNATAGYRPNPYSDGKDGVPITVPATDAARTWNGYGTALKPAFEPIVLAMKPLNGTFAQNALKWGVAGLAIDAGRIETGDKMSFSKAAPFTDKSGSQGRTWNPTSTKGMEREQNPQGRWPANVLLDEEAAAMLDEQSGQSATKRIENPSMCDEEANTWGGTFQRNRGARGHSDSGGASRFFYTAKASRSERDAGLDGMPLVAHGMSGGARGRLAAGEEEYQTEGIGLNRISKVRNNHPTVKPLALMEYLCKLTRPPTGGVVLDPFMGSGTTGVACVKLGRSFLGMEINADYFKIAQKRIADAQAQMVMPL